MAGNYKSGVIWTYPKPLARILTAYGHTPLSVYKRGMIEIEIRGIKADADGGIRVDVQIEACRPVEWLE